MAYSSSTNLYDSASNRYAFIDRLRHLRVANTKRIIGSNFGGTIDTTYLYTVSTAGSGAASASIGTATFATGTTADSSVSMVSKGKIRTLSGRNNVFRAVCRFADTGTANNVREFGIYVDANNQFTFRLSGTTFSVVTKRNGVETVVNNGSFNGNGTLSNQSWTVDANFHSFELLYSMSSIEFLIDNNPIHVVSATSQSVTGAILGQLYISNANSGGSTSDVSIQMLAWSGSQIGDAINNPQYYHINAVAETRTLKGGGGTLQSISIGRAAGAGGTLTLYDNNAGTGTIIGIWDLAKDQVIGTHVFGIEGVNFYTGLTYVTSGTMTNGSITIFWE